MTAGQPASRYGLDCGTPASIHALVSGLFTTEVAAIDPILYGVRRRDRDPQTDRDPRRSGGSVCEWSNGVPMNDQYGWDPDYVGITISVVPRATAGWSEYATMHAMPAEESQCDETWCWASSAVGDAWVTVSAFGGGDLCPGPAGLAVARRRGGRPGERGWTSCRAPPCRSG